MRRFSEVLSGAPGEIRTPDQLVRSQLLYPTELRVRERTVPKRQNTLKHLARATELLENLRAESGKLRVSNTVNFA